MAKKSIDEAQVKRTASDLYAKGKYKKALPLYLQLSQITPKDLKVKTKVGEILHKLGRQTEAAAVYKSVAAQYASDGQLIQAIAVNKLVLQMNPKDAGIQRELTMLYSRKQEEASGSALGRIGTVIRPIQIREIPAPAVQPAADRADTGYAATAVSDPVEDLSLPLEIQVPVAKEDVDLELTEEMEIPGRIIDFTQEIDLDAIAEVSLPPTPLFSDLDADAFDHVLKIVKRRDLIAGEKLCQENEPGDSIFIVSEGVLSVVSRDTKGEPIELAQLSEGEFCGEFGYFSNRKRHATVTARTEAVVLEMDRADLEDLVRSYAKVGKVLEQFYRKRLLDTLLAKSRIFRPLSTQERRLLTQRFEPESHPAGTVIVREGEDGEALYLIEQGTCEITTKKEGRKVFLAHMWDGNFFGEFAVFTGTKRTATVTSVTPVRLLRLSKKDAQETLAQHEGMAKVLKEIYDERVAKTIQVLTTESTTLQDRDELRRGMV